MIDPNLRHSNEASIVVGWGATVAEALSHASPVQTGPGKVLLLPSSLRRTDRFTAVLCEVLRAGQLRSQVVLPVNPLAEVIRLPTKDLPLTWQTVTVHLPDASARTIRVPERLMGTTPLWSVTNVDAVSGRGPFVLDLLARYLHPVSRLRQLTTRSRVNATVEVNLAVPLAQCVVGKAFASFAIAGVTTDRIAGELFALALAEEDLSTDRTVAGPWEDRMIQRAAELELGVQIPQLLSIDLTGDPEAAVRATLERVASRMGVRLW